MKFRRLILMRHAESPWEGVEAPDHERPLGATGREQGPRVGAALVQKGWLPQIVLSSDAQRTRETFDGLSEGFVTKVEVRFLSSFYQFGQSAAEEEMLILPETVSCALLLGHNPGWEHLVEKLTGKAVAMEPATAVVAAQQLGTWGDAASAEGWELEEVITARTLPAGDQI
ncbi:MAG TPA: phosphohistidine phosphatase [Verrucomicrobiales bacterium]|nr:phosphohistidine phosphatase [Verrucomicrobiales bacterium]|tara:strand:+ start:408 stop:920 length:513 start_codon:yes stop_codon:yes gene_type:complete